MTQQILITFLKIKFGLETQKMLFVLASLAAFFLAPAASQEMVTVGFYGEALCPDCINFIKGPLTMAFKEVVDAL